MGAGGDVEGQMWDEQVRCGKMEGGLILIFNSQKKE